MSAKLHCICAILLGAGVGACLPAASGGEEQVAQTDAASSMLPDAPLEIAINQFPGGYQGRWATSQAACAGNDDNVQLMSLQGKLVKFHESVGTMTEGKRETSRSMVAKFDFVGEGEKWTKSIAFKLGKDGKTLTRIDGNDGQSYLYEQCPKLMAG